VAITPTNPVFVQPQLKDPCTARSRATSILASVPGIEAIRNHDCFPSSRCSKASRLRVLAGLSTLSQKICPATSAALRQNGPACLHLPHFARGQAASCAPVPAPPALSASRSSFGRGFFVRSGHGAENTSDNFRLVLFGARLWNQSRNETAIAMEHYRRYRGSGRLKPPTAETLAFRKAFIGGAQRKECPMIRHLCRYRRFGSIYRRACHGRNNQRLRDR